MSPTQNSNYVSGPDLQNVNYVSGPDHRSKVQSTPPERRTYQTHLKHKKTRYIYVSGFKIH